LHVAAGGNGTTLSTIPTGSSTWEIDDGISPASVVTWFNNGQPAGAIKPAVQNGVTDLLEVIQSELAAGRPLITGARSGISNTLRRLPHDHRLHAHLLLHWPRNRHHAALIATAARQRPAPSSRWCRQYGRCSPMPCSCR
jgi:hypothetical protein